MEATGVKEQRPQDTSRSKKWCRDTERMALRRKDLDTQEAKTYVTSGESKSNPDPWEAGRGHWQLFWGAKTILVPDIMEVALPGADFAWEGLEVLVFMCGVCS